MISRPPEMTDSQYMELLTLRLDEAEDVLEAIRTGSVDALLIQGDQGETVYTLDHADKPYRLLVEQMQEGAVTISADGVVLYANQRFGDIMSSPLDRLFGGSFQQYISTTDRHRFTHYLSDPAEKNFRREVSISRCDGRSFPGYLSFSRLPADYSGEAVFCGVVTDLTEQKLMETRLHQSQKMEALGQLTGGLAHDFNNLLQAIQGSFDLIIRRPDSEKVPRWADSGLRVADRGAKLTAQLLAFSRSQKLELTTCSVNRVIAGMSDLLLTTIGQDISLALALDSADNNVLTDPVQLELAILNLTINARDAMSGSGQLRITTRHQQVHEFLDSAHGFLEVCVVDTGVGMSDETRLNAFNPFFTTKDVGQGTGLGLSQVESIVQQSGGAVSIQSAEGAGTTIRLVFPCSDTLQQIEGSADEPALIAPSNLRVLVVDDDDEVRGMLVEMLGLLDHAVIEASSGPAGLEAFREHELDLVILDFAMPGMNGAQVAHELQQIDGKTRILFVSGYSDTAQLRNVMNANTSLLRKPFTTVELERTVAEIFRL
ncbi:response regulator [Pseudomonas sp.]|uniref:response regulator n=1 Tax=Pseudomonas sp. TaxID=306 RepID=UPI002EDA76AF